MVFRTNTVLIIIKNLLMLVHANYTQTTNFTLDWATRRILVLIFNSLFFNNKNGFIFDCNKVIIYVFVLEIILGGHKTY